LTFWAKSFGNSVFGYTASGKGPSRGSGGGVTFLLSEPIFSKKHKFVGKLGIFKGEMGIWQHEN